MTEIQTFADLGLADAITGALSERGSRPLPVQALTIPDALAGRDVYGKAKTGSGKTLAFGLPVLQLMAKAEPKKPPDSCSCRPVSSPIRCATNWRPPPRYRPPPSPFTAAHRSRNRSRSSSRASISSWPPGRMIDLIERDAISVAAVNHVVVERSRPYGRYGLSSAGRVDPAEMSIRSPDAVVLGHARRCGQHLDQASTRPIRPYEVVSEEVTVEQMTHRFVAVHKMDKAKVAAASPSRPSARSCSPAPRQWLIGSPEELEELDVKAAPIHGDLRQSSREKSRRTSVTASFTRSATDVAARGIHVDDVDVVIPRPAQRSQDLPASSGPHARAGEVRPGCDLVAVGRGVGRSSGSEAHRLCDADRRDVLQRCPPGRSDRVGSCRRLIRRRRPCRPLGRVGPNRSRWHGRCRRCCCRRSRASSVELRLDDTVVPATVDVDAGVSSALEGRGAVASASSERR